MPHRSNPNIFALIADLESAGQIISSSKAGHLQQCLYSRPKPILIKIMIIGKPIELLPTVSL